MVRVAQYALADRDGGAQQPKRLLIPPQLCAAAAAAAAAAPWPIPVPSECGAAHRSPLRLSTPTQHQGDERAGGGATFQGGQDRTAHSGTRRSSVVVDHPPSVFGPARGYWDDRAVRTCYSSARTLGRMDSQRLTPQLGSPVARGVAPRVFGECARARARERLSRTKPAAQRASPLRTRATCVMATARCSGRRRGSPSGWARWTCSKRRYACDNQRRRQHHPTRRQQRNARLPLQCRRTRQAPLSPGAGRSQRVASLGPRDLG